MSPCLLILMWLSSLPVPDAVVLGGAYYGEGTQFVINLPSVSCRGDESSILMCIYSQWNYGCSHSDDVGVRCLEAEPLPPGM